MVEPDGTHIDAALTEAQRQERAEQHAAIERQRAADEALVRALAKDDTASG